MNQPLKLTAQQLAGLLVLRDHPADHVHGTVVGNLAAAGLAWTTWAVVHTGTTTWSSRRLTRVDRGITDAGRAYLANLGA